MYLGMWSSGWLRLGCVFSAELSSPIISMVRQIHLLETPDGRFTVMDVKECDDIINE